MSVKRKPVNFSLTLFGETKHYQVYTLVRRDAMEVMHTTLQPILSAVATVAKDKKNIDFTSIVNSIDFETIFNLGEKLLSGSIVDKNEIDFEDYFGSHPTELYPAIFKALQCNYPDVFMKLQKVIDSVSDRLEVVMGAMHSQESKESSETTK